MSDGTETAANEGSDEVDRSALDQWLGDAGYSDEQLATMSNEEKLSALGWDGDDLAEALAEDGWTPEQIAAMSPDERAAAVWETIAEYETLERFGYTEDELDSMTPDERSETLSDMENLRAAGYDPAGMTADEREEALDRLADDDPDNDTPEEDPFSDDTFDGRDRPGTGHDRPGRAWEPDDEDIDPFEEDPDDPEDEDLLEDEAISDAVARELDAEDDAEFARLLEGDDEGGDMMVGEGGAEGSPASSDGPRPWDDVQETETKSEWLDDRGAGMRRGSTAVATDDEYGVLSETTLTEAEVGPSGASYESSFESTQISPDGTVSTMERGTVADVGPSGVDLGREVANKTVYADGSSDERSSASTLELDPDGFDVSVANTDIRTDADGNWEGTIRSAEATLGADGLSAGDSLDSRADGGPLGERGIQRDSSIDLGLDGIDLSDQGSVTLGGHTVEGDFDLQLGDNGADLGLDVDLGLDLDLGGVELAPLPMPSFGMVEMPELTLMPMNDPLTAFPEVVTDIADTVADTVNDAVDDFADNAPPPPPPPPSPDDVGDAMNDFFG